MFGRWRTQAQQQQRRRLEIEGRRQPREPWLYRQGDIMLCRVEAAPKAARPLPRERGRVVLAHGEVTGHAHAIAGDRAELVSRQGAADLFLLVHGVEPVELTHEEHDTLLIPPGSYRLNRQREYVPQRPPRQVAD